MKAGKPLRDGVMSLTLTRVIALGALILLVSLVPLPRANAQVVGLVCLAPTSVSQCPGIPVTITGTVGSQLSVSVFVQDSDSINGFDITLKVNSSILKPVDAYLSGSLLSGGSVLLKCIGLALKQGPVCSSTDTPDTIHFAVAGPVGFLTTFPSMGLLFTAVYNVTSSTSSALVFQTGCSQSSVSGTSMCVGLSNGTILPVPENVQTATYTQAPIPTLILTVDFANVAVGKRSSTNLTLTVFSINGLSGAVSISTSLSPSNKHPPSLLLSPPTVNLVSGGLATSILTITEPANTTTGIYFITVTAQSGTASGSIQIELQVNP